MIERARSAAAAALESLPTFSADAPICGPFCRSESAAALIGLWRQALHPSPATDVQDLAGSLGHRYFREGIGAGTISEAAAMATRLAISAVFQIEPQPSLQLIDIVTGGIADPTVLVIDAWSRASLSPETIVPGPEAEAQKLQEHLRELEVLALVDPLTRLFNRRHFDRALDAETARARRHGLALCLVMVDIDHFKRINDSYGHVCGDEVLCHVAESLQGQARKSDILARYGGEEFVLILPETTFANASGVAERMRRTLEERPVAFGDGLTIQVTASMGYAALEPADTPRTLLERADAALYRAKEAGRNCVSG